MPAGRGRLNHDLHHETRPLPIIIPTLISPLIVRVVNIVVETLNIPDLISHPSCSFLRQVLDILDAVIELVLDAPFVSLVVILNVSGDVLDVLDLLLWRPH